MDKPTCIGMLTARFYPREGGAEVQCRRLSKRLIASGQKVLILTQKLPQTADFELIDNIPVFRLGLPILNKIGSFFYFLSSVRMILKRYEELDILHAHIASAPALVAAFVTSMLGKPSLVKFAGSRFSGDIAVSLRTLAGRIKLNFLRDHANAFVCPSGEIADELIKYGFAKDKINVIANGVETDDFKPLGAADKQKLRSSLGLPPAGKIFVYSGRLENGKGLQTLINAWKVIESGRLSPAPLLLIAGSGSLLDELKDQASGLSTLSFLGWKNNVADYLKAGDAFILPSSGEGMPNSLLEAMACGLSCVATDIGGIKELIEHGRTGLLFPAGDQSALVSSVKTLVSDETLLAKLGQSARETVINNYSIDRITQQYLSLYRKIIHGER